MSSTSTTQPSVAPALRVRLRRDWRLILAALVLAIPAALQVRIVWLDYGREWVQRVSQTIELPAWKRAAIYLGGQQFADYIEFVRLHAPEDARVILPPREPVATFSNVGFVQYFLFPRDIHNCGINEVEDCIRRVQGENTYILGVGYFPPPELASQFKNYLPFDDELGLYVPSGALE